MPSSALSHPPRSSPLALFCLSFFCTAERVPDALLVVCGDHFGLIVDRPPELMERGHCPAQATGGRHSAETGLVGLVDAALERGDRDTAVAYLSLEASHGRISGQGGESTSLGVSRMKRRNSGQHSRERGSAFFSLLRKVFALHNLRARCS